MFSKPISVVSTYTSDILIDSGNKLLDLRSGGPAYFISAALSTENVDFELITGNDITTEILITKEGEYGKIPIQPKSLHLKNTKLNPWTIVSTVLDEWDISNISLPDYTFIDIQGFVRNGSDFGIKKVWKNSQKIIAQSYCIKGTAEEINMLPAPLLETQKKKLLIITNGSKGLDLYVNGKQYFLAVNELKELPDTIGAGDTFFAYMVAGMYKGLSAVDACVYSINKTTFFLENKYVKMKLKNSKKY
jgi:hypothetical protein